MIKKNTEPAKLVTYNRDGLIEREHFGYIVRCDKIHTVEKLGDDKNYPFYMRSCAKPLQASLLIDYELDEKFNLTYEEIAICAASHAGESVHVELVKRLLDKFEVSPDKLKCGNHDPISRTAQDELLLQSEKPTAIHNNCSGKHAMMLGLCKINDWDMDNYDNPNHPLQIEIKKKIYESSSSNMLSAVRPTFFAELEVLLLSLADQEKIAKLNLLAKQETQLLKNLADEKERYYTAVIDHAQKNMRRKTP